MHSCRTCFTNMSSSFLNIFLNMCFLYFAMGTMMEKTAENYGPFVAKWNEYGACKAPKAVNLTNFNTYLVVENNTYQGVMNFTFVTFATVEQVRLMVYSVKAGRRSLLWSYRIDKPCQHYAISEILQTHFGVSDCNFKKGNYFWVVNFTECTYKYLGTSFFYGEFMFKLIAMSKKGNIACLYFNPVFMKKT